MTDEATPQRTVTVTLAFRPPYDWRWTSTFLAARAIPGVERVDAHGYHRSIVCDGVPGRIAVHAGDATLMAAIVVDDRALVPTIATRLREIFDLDADAPAIGAHLSRDPMLAPLVAARPGLRVTGAWDGFELAVRAILGQQITVAGASALAGKLVAAYGTKLPPGLAADGLTHLFPAPQTLAEATDIGAIGMPRARGSAIARLARAACDDPHLFRRGRSLDESVARLRTLPGIGEWTAQYIAMRALREPDAFPAADIGLLRAAATPAGRPSPAQLRARAETWRPFRAYAAQLLWASAADRKPV